MLISHQKSLVESCAFFPFGFFKKTSQWFRMARYARVGIVVGVLVIYKVNNGKIPHCAIVFWVVVGKTALAKRLLFQAYFFDFFSCRFFMFVCR